MKKFLIISNTLMLLLSGCNAKQKDIYKKLIKPGKANVILITGQSNASGNSPWMYLKEKNPEVYNKFKDGVNNVLTSYYVHSSNYKKYFSPTTFGMADFKDFFGPEIGIADVFSKSNEVTYIIKYAIGGSRLDNEWLNSNGERGKLYNDSIDWFKKRLKYLKSRGVQPNIVGQFWMQGESDSNDEFGYKYGTNLSNMISFYRNDLKDYYMDHYTFVDAYISTKTLWPNPNLVNNQKQIVADSDSNVFCIKTNGEDENAINLDVKLHSGEGDDQAHYDSQSQYLLGERAGKIIQENLSK